METQDLKKSLTATPQVFDNSPEYILRLLGVSMPRGNVRCSKCHKAMSRAVCECGHSAAYISIYWGGKRHRFFRYYLDGELFNYERAVKQLAKQNLAMEEKTFRPRDWTEEAFRQRLFSGQAEKWINQKVEEKEAGEFAPATLKSYRGYVRNHFTFFADMDIREIDYADLEDFKDELAAKGVKIKTRRNVMNGLHALFTWMYRRGVIKAVPPFPIIEGDDSRVMTALSYQAQVEALEKLPEAHRDVFSFGFECGLRPGELCAVRVKDIDPFKRWALIQRTYSSSEIKESTKAKNKKWIPLSDRAYELAMKHMKDKLPEAFLFINPETGRGYRVEYIRRVWRLHSGTAVTLYEGMRHSFCTQLVEDGASDREAQELMRHVDRRSTERYIHASVERHRNLVNRRGRGKVVSIERALNEPTSSKSQ